MATSCQLRLAAATASAAPPLSVQQCGQGPPMQACLARLRELLVSGQLHFAHGGVGLVGRTGARRVSGGSEARLMPCPGLPPRTPQPHSAARPTLPPPSCFSFPPASAHIEVIGAAVSQASALYPAIR